MQFYEVITMVCTVQSLGLHGVSGYPVSAECALSGGLPAFDVVGLPDAAVKESRERVRSAIKSSGFDFPVSRITVNLAPADRRKVGTVYDLPILVGILAAGGQLSLAREELSYLQSVLDELSRADTEQALEEIRRELCDGGYVKADSGKKRAKQGKLAPMRFESTDGFAIYVGRNNRQNDELTFKMARKDDLWLHASKVHGSHVIIACAGVTPPDNTVTQAAQLAAHYAETAGGQNIAVDVTPVKQVKRIPSGKPGMVIYHMYRTVIANPYPDIVVDALNAE